MTYDKPIIGYLIKPIDRTVQRVTVCKYEDIYRWCEYDTFDHCLIDPNGDGVFVDDEGLLKENPPNNFFVVKGRTDPLCGNGLVLGCDAEGESVSPQTDWEAFKKMVIPVLVAKINGRLGYIPGRFQFLEPILPPLPELPATM